MESNRDAVAGPMPLSGLVKMFRAVVMVDEVDGRLLRLEKAD